MVWNCRCGKDSAAWGFGGGSRRRMWSCMAAVVPSKSSEMATSRMPSEDAPRVEERGVEEEEEEEEDDDDDDDEGVER